MHPLETVTCTRYFTVAMAGHVDHGKTSLLRRLTGIDPDRLKEEKERQMTTDLGFAHLLLPGAVGVGFIDVPGHGKFLKNMLAGVGGVDLALLVVAADEGPMPQTRQHVKILSLLGVQSVLVAITKIDLASPLLLEDVARSVHALLSVHEMEEAGCVHLSCTRGTGFDRLPFALSEALERTPPRHAAGGAFLPIDRVFTKPGYGTVVTGTLVRGTMGVGDQVIVEPGDIRARVRRLESLGQPVSAVTAGQRVAANLVMKDGGELRRGHVLLAYRITPVSSLIVSLQGAEERLAAGLGAGLAGQDVRFYHGTAESHGHVRWLDAAPSAEANAGSRSLHIAQVALAEPVVAEPADRFVMRAGDETIYGGMILLRDRPRWLTRERLKQLTPKLLRGDYAAAAADFIAMSPQHMVPTDALHRFLPASLRQALPEELTASGTIVRLAEYLLTPAAKQAIGQRLIQLLADRQKRCAETGESLDAPLEHVRLALQPGFDRAAFQALIQEMIDAGAIVRRADKLGLPEAAADHADARLQTLRQGIEQQLATSLCLEMSELAALLKATPKQVRLALESLSQSGKADIVAYDYASLSESLVKAHTVLAAIWKEKGDISPGEFRERLGTSRKYAMALLAYFDDQHITRRVGNGRVLLKQPGT